MHVRRLPPWLFGLLILPEGFYLGLVSLVFPVLLAKAGMRVDQTAHLVSILSLPWIGYFLWSPLVDTKLTQRTWLILGTLLAAVCLSATLHFAGHAQILHLTVVGLFGSWAASIVMAACGGLILSRLPASDRGTASAWYEAGKLTGVATGAAVIIWLVSHLTFPLGIAAAGLLAGAPALAALTIADSKVTRSPKLMPQLALVRHELAALISSPRKCSLILILISPLGVGAATALLPGIANRYAVSAREVLWINGFAGGIILAAGSLAGALIPRQWDKRASYVASGLINALSILILFGGRSPAVYYAGTTIYLASAGLCWAVYAALVAEAAEAAGPLVSTRYSLLSSAGNVPLAYMLWMDGLAYRHFGINGLLCIDGGGTLTGIAVAVFSIYYFRKGPE